MVEHGSKEGVTNMKRILMLVLGLAVAMTAVAAAIAQSNDPASGAKSTPPTPSSSTKTPEATTQDATPVPDASAMEKEPAAATVSGSAAAEAAAKVNPEIDRVKERGLKASAKEREIVDKKLDEIEKQIENEATAKGDAAVAGRIAGEFGVTADALTAERSQFSRGWGEILVAHTLLANAKPGLTIADIFQMRNQGIGWGVIAAGLDLKLGDVVSAVKSEGRVAAGLAKGDGKPATIRAGASASLRAGTKAQAKPVGAKGGVTAGTGVGVGVDLNKGSGK
jgi:hypothetical protein